MFKIWIKAKNNERQYTILKTCQFECDIKIIIEKFKENAAMGTPPLEYMWHEVEKV